MSGQGDRVIPARARERKKKKKKKRERKGESATRAASDMESAARGKRPPANFRESYKQEGGGGKGKEKKKEWGDNYRVCGKR